MLFSEAEGRQVLSTGTAATVGTVEGFLVDPASARVVAVRLKSPGNGDTLHWRDVTSFGADLVTISSADVIVAASGQAAELDTKAARLPGKRILTDGGVELGTVRDVEFNPDNGSVIAIVTAAGPVSGERLLGCGSYAVVVTAQ